VHLNYFKRYDFLDTAQPTLADVTIFASAMDQNKLLELMESKEKKNLEELGGVGGLAKALGSDINAGLTATTEQDLHHRKEQYGVNVLERKPPPSVWDMFVEAIQDTTLVILLMAAGMNYYGCAGI
jgi:P-type Ca2+ transporter type 2C